MQTSDSFVPPRILRSAAYRFSGLMLFACLTASQLARAQNSGNSSETPKTSAAQQTEQKLPTVKTTVEVQGKVEEAYVQNATLGGFEDLPLAETPRSALVVSRSVMDDQQAKVLSDVTKNDASIVENYAPVGFYQAFQIRGFPIDLATGLKMNGLTIAGEQILPLETIDHVEFLKGVTGLEAGVASAGGLINFVTKRPAVVRTVTLETDQRGTALGSLDIGGFFGARKQFGLRANMGGEMIRSYVNGADGSREFGALSGDWKINSKTFLRGDFGYQHQVQRSVGGYQLLGGTTVPTDVYPSTMLGRQPWAKPNTFDAVNASVRLERTFTEKWRAYVTGGISRSVIDDYIAYAYGCYSVTACNTGGPPQPWFFSPTGDYDVYDYRSPGERRIDNQFQAMLLGREKTGPISHNLLVGTSLLRRSVELSGAVFDYVGTDNIYQPLQQFSPSLNTPGPRTLQVDSHQYAVVLQDRVELPGNITVSIGGQIDTLHDHNYSQVDPVTGEPYLKATNKTVWLPQYSITYRPIDKLTVYGNYGVALSLGLQAPFWVRNGSQFLDPFFTRQVEMGAKYAVSEQLLLTADVFRMRAPFFYPKPAEDGLLDFVSQGHETHSGFEFSAQGRVTNWLRLTLSTAAISAISSDTGTPAFDDKQVINQPRFRSTLSADVLVPHVPGLAILPGWIYTGRKSATRDDVVSVGGYHLFSLGLRYTPQRGESRVTFRLYADNLTNKRYWKDTGSSFGDTFLHLGAPTTVRLSTQFTF